VPFNFLLLPCSVSGFPKGRVGHKERNKKLRKFDAALQRNGITAILVVIEPQIQTRGTAPVRLLYVPEDSGCRAPTAWYVYLKNALM
jgi:hypothetical protein